MTFLPSLLPPPPPTGRRRLHPLLACSASLAFIVIPLKPERIPPPADPVESADCGAVPATWTASSAGVSSLDVLSDSRVYLPSPSPVALSFLFLWFVDCFTIVASPLCTSSHNQSLVLMPLCSYSLWTRSYKEVVFSWVSKHLCVSVHVFHFLFFFSCWFPWFGIRDAAALCCLEGEICNVLFINYFANTFGI